jgi:biopolymer transport protein ExbB/TolQ
MTGLLSKYWLIGALLVAICLGGINGVLTYRLDKAIDANQVLSDKNKDLNDAVADRDETISALQGAADADRRATEEQLKIEQQKREKADVENRTLRKALEHSDCSNQRLPDSAIDVLRRED